MTDIKKIYINEIGDESAVIYVKSNGKAFGDNGSRRSSVQNEITARDVMEQAAYSLKERMDTVKEVMKCTYNSLTSDITKPDELEIELGLELSSDAGVVLVSAGMTANITVKAVWKKEEN